MFKKACMVTLLAAGMLFGIQSGASAIDFKAKGEWIVGFALGDGKLASKDSTGARSTDDKFEARQRVRLQLDAVASEALSGTVWFEIGDQTWGDNTNDFKGGALGADGNEAVKVKNAYIDWLVPSTDLKFRMGLQALVLPNAAGGSAVMDGDAAAVVASYKFNENVGLTALWMRPVNDNYTGTNYHGTHNHNGYLDNVDLFMLSLPLTFDGVEVTPWLMYGMLGKNALAGLDDFYDRRNLDGEARAQGADPTAKFGYTGNGWGTQDGDLATTLTGWSPMMNVTNAAGDSTVLGNTSKGYGSMFWAGLPIALTLWDPLNIEIDLNYGYVEAMGNFFVKTRNRDNDLRRGSTQRQGWLLKALVEYKLDWGVPGIFGWYASGDDGDIKNGSERMPSIAGAGSFTSFVGYGGLDWTAKGGLIEWQSDYSGTWGLGLQLRDLSFLEDLSHTFRVALWGGTNSPSMVKYMKSKDSWADNGMNSPYLTTNDYLLEFNLDTEYKIYENLAMNLDLGYVVNMIDSGTWNRSYLQGKGPQKQDAWKAQVAFVYSF